MSTQRCRADELRLTISQVKAQRITSQYKYKLTLMSLLRLLSFRMLLWLQSGFSLLHLDLSTIIAIFYAFASQHEALSGRELQSTRKELDVNEYICSAIPLASYFSWSLSVMLKSQKCNYLGVILATLWHGNVKKRRFVR